MEAAGDQQLLCSSYILAANVFFVPVNTFPNTKKGLN